MNKKTAILKAGLLVGTLDIIAAFVYVFARSGNFVPLSILKFVASGIFGKSASTGGNSMIIAGIVIHYFIAFAFTGFFFWLFPRLQAAAKNKIISGIIYGLFIWSLMNLVILPLSNVSARTFSMMNAIINIFILIICIGIPLSFMASSFYKKLSLSEL